MALVELPGVSGAPVGNWPGVKTDFRGYTTLSNLTPYQKNDININPLRLPDDAAVSQTTVSVVPTRGAIVKAKFRTSVGKRVLLKLVREDGSPVPFGAVVTVEGNDNSTGIGRVYLTGVQERGRMMAFWGAGQTRRCTADIHVPEKANNAGVYIAQTQCRG